MGHKRDGADNEPVKETRSIHLPKPGLIGFPQKDWGRSSAATGYPPHLHIRHVVVPEGILMIMACTRCGEREEVLADLRTLMMLIPGGGTVQPTDYDFLEPSEEWLAQHRACQGGLTSLSPMTSFFVDELLRATEEILRSGEPLFPTCWLQTGKSGTGVGILPVEELIDPTLSDRARVHRVLLRHFGLRELIRRSKLDLQAVALVVDVYVNEDTPALPFPGLQHGDEGLLLALATLGGARTAWIPITRSGGAGKVVEGLAQPIWEPMGSSVWVDGIFVMDVMPTPIGPVHWSAGLN